MKVEIHKLFQYLLETTDAAPEAVLGYSFSRPPRLKDFLDELDPELSLDWNNRSFLGLPELRANVLAQAGLDRTCGLDDVLITAGAAEANFLAITQLLQPGDEMLTERPGWPQAEVLARAKGCKVHSVRRLEADGWALPLDELESAIGPRTRLVFLSNPNNPTGRLMDRADLEAVAEIAARHEAWLIVDEVYAGLEWEGVRAPSIAGIYERGITTGSVSKALGLQGLRTGWLICRDPEVVRDAYVLRENSSEIMNVLGEHVTEIALRPERLDAALASARAEGAANLDRLDRFIAGQERLVWRRPQAGLIGLARLEADIDGETLARRLLDPPYRTFLIPGNAYGEPRHIRLGVGGGEEVNLDEGLSRLADLLATL